MKASPFLFIIILLSCSSFFSHRLYAQQQVFNKKQNHSYSSVKPWDTRAIDSLQKINDGYFLNRSSLQPQNKVRSFPKTTPGKRPYRLKQVTQNTPINRQGNERVNTVCYTISGRNYLYQDSLLLWSGNPSLTSDGNVLVSGEFTDYSASPFEEGGFCMKTDYAGNIIWCKLFDSVAAVTYDYMHLAKSLELRNGSIVLGGRTTNKFSGNDDFVLTKLDNNGNLIWLKTYESRFWQGFNGSGDYFAFKDLKEDPVTGEIYFVGSHWGGISVVTKVDPNDGHIIWSTGYDTYGTEQVFGIEISNNNLLLFHLENGYSNDSYINVTAINKSNGDTLYNKSIRQTGDLYAARLYTGYEVIKLTNGHYRLSGPTTRYFEYPAYTGTVDLYYAGIIELDENLNFVKAFGFKNRVNGNYYNTKISLFPDGSGVFTMIEVFGGYTAEAHISLFKNDLIYHQRKRLHYNEGIPYEPPTLQLTDGGLLNIKLMGDSTVSGEDGSRLDYYQMHTSDTASTCLGLKDSANSIWYFNFEPAVDQLYSIQTNVFHESRVKTFNTWNFTAHSEPTCQIISFCDTLNIKAITPTIICPGSSLTLAIHKNKECGSLVPLAYDTNFVHRVVRDNDTTYTFYFDKPGSGYIHGSLMGCVLHKDSVLVEVTPARYSLDLGPDTVICPSNPILLNAGKGFASYLWQDGSSDSTLTITAPGTYYLTVVNSCGATYSDTIRVADHPPIPINIGPDRTKCNNDTLVITAPAGFTSYVWTPNYNISSPITQQVIVSPQKDTSYTVAAEKSPGCFAYDTIRITVKKSPLINLGADTSICKGDTLNLDAGPGFDHYLWSNGINQQQLAVNQAGTFSVIATTPDGCSSADTVKLLSIFNLPKPDLGPDSVVCTGQSRILKPKGNYASYLWNTGATSNTIAVSLPGQYSLFVVDANGCKGADTTIIPSMATPPTAFLGEDTTLCTYGTLVLTLQGSFNQRLWSTGSTASSIKVTQAGSYWLQVTDNNNCKGRDTVVVIQKQCSEGLYVPSAFTPNGDGLNDLLRPLLFGNIKFMKFQIFNRWGEIIFQTNTPGQGWDGNYKGQKQDPGVFVWMCNYQLDGKQIENSSGTFVLIR